MKEGGRKKDDEGSTQRPKPECRDPSEKEKREGKDGAPQKGGRRAPEERGGEKGGGKHAAPPRDDGGTGQEGSLAPREIESSTPWVLAARENPGRKPVTSS